MIVLTERVSTTQVPVPEAYLQRRHTYYKPEILLAEDVPYTQVPRPGLGVVQVFENGKSPWRATVSIYNP
jgi:hypothetical protein